MTSEVEVILVRLPRAVLNPRNAWHSKDSADKIKSAGIGASDIEGPRRHNWAKT